MKANVLFLCTGNSCRSQMAEAFLRRFAGDMFTVFSAGLEPGLINPWTYRAMAELGYDLVGQRSKHVHEYQGVVDFDYVITVCDDADKNCPAFLGRARHRMHWGFEDPAKFAGNEEETLSKFRQVRDAISVRISTWLDTGE